MARRSLGRLRLSPAALAGAALAGALTLAGCRGPLASPNAASAGTQPAESWNVLLVTLDTVRADHVGCYGDRSAETPALDRLAREGVRFARALVSGAAHPALARDHPHRVSSPRITECETTVPGVSRRHETLATRSARPATRPAPSSAPSCSIAASASPAASTVYDDAIVRDARRRDEERLEAERPAATRRGRPRASAWLAARDSRGPFFALGPSLRPARAVRAARAVPRAYRGRPYDGEIAYADAAARPAARAPSTRAGSPQRRSSRSPATTASRSASTASSPTASSSTSRRCAFRSLLRRPGVRPAGRTTPVSRSTCSHRRGPRRHPLGRRRGSTVRDRLDGARRAARATAPEAVRRDRAIPRASAGARCGVPPRRGRKLIAAPRPELYDLPSRIRARRATSRPSAPRRWARLGRTRRGLGGLGDRTAAPVPLDPESGRGSRAWATSPPAAPRGGQRRRDGRAPIRRTGSPLYRALRGRHLGRRSRRRRRAARQSATARRARAGKPGLPPRARPASRAAGRHRRSGAGLRAAAPTTPDDPEAWHERALAQAGAGRLAERRRATRRAIALDPLLPEPHNHLGVLLARQGRFGDALASFDSAIALDPNDARA